MSPQLNSYPKCQLLKSQLYRSLVLSSFLLKGHMRATHGTLYVYTGVQCFTDHTEHTVQMCLSKLKLYYSSLG